MSRHKGTYEHGTLSRYRQGDCSDLAGVAAGARCADCRRAMSDFNKAEKAGVKPEGGTVVSMTGRTRSNSSPAQSNSKPSASNPEPAMGPVERSIREQFEPYRGEHAARVELLIRAALVMDNVDNKGIWPTTMRNMEIIIDKITAKKKTKSGGRLATVAAMAGRKSS